MTAPDASFGPQGTGNCFEIAVELLLSDRTLSEHAMLVHALVSAPRSGLRHTHAWVEDNGLAIDRANGLDVTIPIDFYYALGHITPDEMHRYTRAQTRAHLRASRHYGPWQTFKRSQP